MKDFNISLLVSILFASLVTLYIHPTSSIQLGGFLLMLGAFYVYKGNIFYSILTYTVADVCWLVNAYMNGDTFGVLTVTIGIIVGSAVVYKMQLGKFKKSIRKDNEKSESKV